MDRIVVQGGYPLVGSIRVSGAKNAGLPLMAASLLTEETLVLANLPELVDISTMAELLIQHGAVVTREAGGRLFLKAADIGNLVAPYDLVRRMRASILVLGPLTARFGEASVSLPGGCAIGTRPVDLHIAGLERLGARISLDGGYVMAHAPGGLRGDRIVLPAVSVGATENLMMAATLARGETALENAAREPEIVDLADCLVAMGARIEGAGTGKIFVQGVDRLGGAEHAVIADRIETGTYAMAAAMTGGKLDLVGARPELLEAVLRTLEEAGLEFEATARGLRAGLARGGLRGTDVATGPYPGFPTDLQAQMMVLMSVARGESTITETIFENRFMHVPELARMGARVDVRGASAVVRGVGGLTGAEVMATDLRASVSLVLAGLAARGETAVRRVYHLDRGYEAIEEKLSGCGAIIERMKE